MGMFGTVKKLVGSGKRDPFQDDVTEESSRGAWKGPTAKNIVWVIFQYGRPTQVELNRTDVNIDHLKKRLKSVFPRHLGHLEAFEFGVKSLSTDSNVIPEDTLLANLRQGSDASSALYIWLPCSSGAPSLVSPAYRHGGMDEDSLWRSGHLESTRFPSVGAPVIDDEDSVSDFESISPSVPPSYNSEAVRAMLKERLGTEPDVVSSGGKLPRPFHGEAGDTAKDCPGSPGSPPATDNLQGSMQNDMYASARDVSTQERSDNTGRHGTSHDFSSVFHHDLAPADLAKLLSDGSRRGALGTQKYSRRAASAQPQRPLREADPGLERSSFEDGTAQLRKASMEDRAGRKFEDEPRFYDNNSFSSGQEHQANMKPMFFSFQADGRWKRGSVGEQMHASAARNRNGLKKPRSFWQSLFKSKSSNDSSRPSYPPPCASTPGSGIYYRTPATYDMQSSNYSILSSGPLVGPFGDLRKKPKLGDNCK